MYIKKPYLVLATILLIISSFLIGLYNVELRKSLSSNDRGSLRANGEKFTSPLLLSDVGNDSTTPDLVKQSDAVNKIISNAKQHSTISEVSVLYRELTNGSQISINSDHKYFPASLGKLPLLMAYFKKSIDDPTILSTRGIINFDFDYNIGQEITPNKFPVSGQEYSIQELLEMMVKNSDNIGYHLLMGQAQAQSLLQEMFEDLQLTYPYAQTSAEDVVTVREYSRFFRLLYNVTYLNEDLSEKALQVLSEVEYSKGILAGVPADVQVAHKFGLDSQKAVEGIGIIGRQLHDCGIVYKPNNPYLLCVMTKSGAGELSDVEKVIADISQYIYKNLPSE